MTIVQKLRSIDQKPKNEFRAIPVMIPGRAIGRTNTNETALCPKNLCRESAKAARDPRTSATAVAVSPALTESQSAPWTSSSCHAAENHFVVNPGIGQLWMFEELNAYTPTIAIGNQRNATTATPQTHSPILVPGVSISEVLEGAETPHDRDEHDHDRERHGREGGCEGDVVGDADVREDDVTDQLGVRTTDDPGCDVVAKREREREDRTCCDSRDGQGKDDAANGRQALRSEVGGRLQVRTGHALEGGVNGQHHERESDVGVDEPHRPVRVEDVLAGEPQPSERPVQNAVGVQDQAPRIDADEV